MRTVCLVVLFGLTWPIALFGQDDPPVDPMKVSELVFELQQKLDDQSIPIRDEAEKKILELGVEALNHLPPIDDSLSEDMRARLVRIRGGLEKLAIIAVTNPGRVTLDGSFSLAELLATIQKQTGNQVVLGDAVAADALDQKLDLKLDRAEFWDVLDRALSKFQLEVDAFGGLPGTLSLRSRLPNSIAMTERCLDYSSILRFEITRVDSTRGLTNADLNRTTYTLVVHWEPRIRPISIDVPLKSIVVVDEFDRRYVQEKEVIQYGMVQPEIPELEFSLPLPLVDRQVEELKSLAGTVQAILPGRIESFEFPDPPSLAEGTSQLKGGATVTFQGSVKNEDLFGMRISLSFSDENNALESHQSWAFQNVAYLMTSDKKRIDYIASETYQQTNNELGVIYYFPENPNDAKLVYQTPAAIVKVDIPFEIKKIKLP